MPLTPPDPDLLLPADQLDAWTARVAAVAGEPAAALYRAALHRTLARTLHVADDGSVFVITGDIPAMWLRDSATQLLPYLPLAAERPDGPLADLLVGVVRRQVGYLAHDPYANAFNAEADGRCHEPLDLADDPWLWERKYEIDSLCFPLLLAHQVWAATGRTDHLDGDFVAAARAAVATLQRETRHETDSDYRFVRPGDDPLDTLTRDGLGAPTAVTGMTWSGFRPSDDACTYGHHVPGNLMAAHVLRLLADLVPGEPSLVAEASALAAGLEAATVEHGVVQHPEHGEIWAYEVDGLGHSVLMDDANMPGLLSLPLVAGVPLDDPRYLRTRDFVLSASNPFFYAGRLAAGVGSPHTEPDHVWPIGLCVEGLTSPSAERRLELLLQVAATTGGTDVVHESFHVDDDRRFSRPWFSWADSMYCALAQSLLTESLVTESLVTESLPHRGRVSAPVRVPTAGQLAWQRMRVGMFLHFGINTFFGCEWSDGTLPASAFDPVELDADAWMATATALGARYVVLTAKHHDGFCLWPTATTDYSVAASPWRGGRGDVVGEVVAAARRAGLAVGLYLSPWDRHEPRYADPAAYSRFYAEQLTELCTRYGPLAELWFDGAGSEGYRYDWPRIVEVVRTHQPDAMVFTMGAPTIRWVGNEDGLAAEPVEYVVERSRFSNYTVQSVELDQALYLPPECDVSLRRGWFHDAADQPKTLEHLLAIYYRSVGLGANLLLNVPPDRRGLLDPADAAVVAELGAELRRRFDGGVPARLTALGGGRWSAELPADTAFDHLWLEEELAAGQRVQAHRVLLDGRLLAEGSTLGATRIHLVGPHTASRLEVELVGDGAVLRVLRVHRTGVTTLPEVPDGYLAPTDRPVDGTARHP